MSSKVVIGEVEVVCKVLEGEEEDKYLTKTMEEIAASKKKYSKGKRSGKKGKNYSNLKILLFYWLLYINDATAMLILRNHTFGFHWVKLFKSLNFLHDDKK